MDDKEYSEKYKEFIEPLQKPAQETMNFVEPLAAYAHEAWSGWMRYLFEKSTLNEDGTVTIPKWAVERWQRQMNTPYNALPEEEKKSDRVEAETILVTMSKVTRSVLDNFKRFEFLYMGNWVDPKK